MLRKPGGAIAISPMDGGVSRWATIDSAIRIGAARATGASCMATLDGPVAMLRMRRALDADLGQLRPRRNGEVARFDRAVARDGKGAAQIGSQAHGASSLASRRSAPERGQGWAVRLIVDEAPLSVPDCVLTIPPTASETIIHTVARATWSLLGPWRAATRALGCISRVTLCGLVPIPSWNPVCKHVASSQMRRCGGAPRG